MKANPYIGRVRTDKKTGEIELRDYIGFPKKGFTPLENLYLFFYAATIGNKNKDRILRLWVGGRTTQWKIRRALRKKGYDV